ncbi:hypothetical protein ACJJTC_005076 [Scirpophaga incertulas]
MDSNDTDNATRTPERSSHQRRYKKRRSRASSSERGGNKHRKTSKGISAEEVLQLLAAWKEGPNSDKFMKQVLVNGKSLTAYIDFGSECTLLRHSDAIDLNLVRSNEDVPIIRGFGNSSIVPLFKSLINLKLDEIETRIEVLVVADQFMHTALLIGQNFTEFSFITVLKTNTQLIFYKSPILINEQLSGQSPLKLFTNNSLQIDNLNVVPVALKDDTFSGDVYVEGYSSLKPGFKIKRKSYESVVSADRIRPWIHVKALDIVSSGQSESSEDSE